MMTNHNNNKTNNNHEQAQDKTAWHSKLLTAGTKFGNEDRITKKKSIKFGLQFAPCLHKVIRKMFRSAKIKAPLKLHLVEVDQQLLVFLIIRIMVVIITIRTDDNSEDDEEDQKLVVVVEIIIMIIIVMLESLITLL